MKVWWNILKLKTKTSHFRYIQCKKNRYFWILCKLNDALTIIFMSGDKHISNSIQHGCVVHGTLKSKRNEHFETSLYTSTGKSIESYRSLPPFHGICHFLLHTNMKQECDFANTRNKSSEEKMTDEKGCCNDFKEEFITNLVFTETSSTSNLSGNRIKRNHSASSGAFEEHLRERIHHLYMFDNNGQKNLYAKPLNYTI